MHSDVVGGVEDAIDDVGGVRDIVVSVDSVGIGVHSDPLHLMVEGNYVSNRRNTCSSFLFPYLQILVE